MEKRSMERNFIGRLPKGLELSRHAFGQQLLLGAFSKRE